MHFTHWLLLFSQLNCTIGAIYRFEIWCWTLFHIWCWTLYLFDPGSLSSVVYCPIQTWQMYKTKKNRMWMSKLRLQKRKNLTQVRNSTRNFSVCYMRNKFLWHQSKWDTHTESFRSTLGKKRIGKSTGAGKSDYITAYFLIGRSVYVI